MAAHLQTTEPEVGESVTACQLRWQTPACLPRPSLLPAKYSKEEQAGRSSHRSAHWDTAIGSRGGWSHLLHAEDPEPAVETAGPLHPALLQAVGRRAGGLAGPGQVEAVQEVPGCYLTALSSWQQVDSSLLAKVTKPSRTKSNMASVEAKARREQAVGEKYEPEQGTRSKSRTTAAPENAGPACRCFQVQIYLQSLTLREILSWITWDLALRKFSGLQ